MRNYGIKVIDSKIDIKIFTTVKLKNVTDEEYQKLDKFYKIAENAFGLVIEPIKRHIKEGHKDLDISEMLKKNNITIDPKFEKEYEEYYGDDTFKEERFIPVNFSTRIGEMVSVVQGERPQLFRFILSAFLARFNYLNSNYLAGQNLKIEYTNWEIIYSKINVFELLSVKKPIEVPVNNPFWIIPISSRKEEFHLTIDTYAFPITPNLCILFEHHHSFMPMSLTYKHYIPVQIKRVEDLDINPAFKMNKTFLIKI